MPDALLSYTLSCTPNPLYVSTEQNREVGQLTLEVGQPFSVQAGAAPIPADTGWDSGPEGTGGGVLNSSGTTPVWCRWFEIVIPIGDKDTDLANIPDQSALQTISIYSPTGWEHAARLFQAPAGQWNAGVKFTAVDRYGDETAYVFNGTNPVNVTISNIPINAMPGFADIPITEYASQTSATAGYAERQALRETPKAEKDFYFYDLHPSMPYVPLGQPPILQWKGNVANSSFTVYWYDGTGYEEAAVAGQSWQCPQDHIPKNTTTFMVAATHVPPGQSKAVTVHLTATVTVTNPVIEATSVTATGNITAAGEITANGDIASRAMLRANKIGRFSGQGNIDVYDNLVLLWGLTATTPNGFVTASKVTSTGDVIAQAALRGDNIGRATNQDGYGRSIVVLNNLEVYYDVYALGSSWGGGRPLLRNGSILELEISRSGAGRKWYLWADTARSNDKEIQVHADTDHGPTNTRWVVYGYGLAPDADPTSAEPGDAAHDPPD